MDEQKKAVRAGYDMDIIPSDLATYGAEAKKLLQELQSRNERMFLLTFLVVNVADNKQRLGNNVFQAGSIAQKYNCQLTRLDFQQEGASCPRSRWDLIRSRSSGGSPHPALPSLCHLAACLLKKQPFEKAIDPFEYKTMTFLNEDIKAVKEQKKINPTGYAYAIKADRILFADKER